MKNNLVFNKPIATWQGRYRRYTDPSSPSYNLEFVKWVDENIPHTDIVAVKQSIIAFIKLNNRRPSHSALELNEKHLAKTMGHYISPSSDTFDSAFRATLEELCPSRKIDPHGNKERILAFVEKNGQKPKRSSDNLDEVTLSKKLNIYLNKDSSGFDQDFKNKIDAMLPNDEKYKEEILEFIRLNSRRPSQHVDDGKENKLHRLLHDYTTADNSKFDKVFKVTVDSILPPRSSDPSGNKLLILDFITKYGFKPSSTSINIEESTLGKMIGTYCSPASNGFDIEFRKKISKFSTKRFASVENLYLQILVEAKKGTPRRLLPKKLLTTLIGITSRSGTNYREEWNTELRQLRSDWFVGIGKGPALKAIQTNPNHHLYTTIYNRHVFSILFQNKHITKSFATKEEAIEYRDKFMKENGLL